MYKKFNMHPNKNQILLYNCLMIYLMIINRGISIDLNQVRDSKISDEMNNNNKKKAHKNEKQELIKLSKGSEFF